MKTQTSNDITFELPETDYELAEVVGQRGWRLVLVCDWENRTMEFESRLEGDNGRSPHEWHGHAESFEIYPMGKKDAASLVESVLPAMAIVCDGYNNKWDGSNHVAVHSPAGDDAKTLIADICRSFQTWDEGGGLWSARDWLDADPPEVAADSTDEDLAKLEQSLEAEAHAEGIALYGTDEYLEKLRTEAQDALLAEDDE